MRFASKENGVAAAFLTSQCVTLLGSAAVQMAVAWYAAVETSSGAWAAAMLVAGFVPQMAVSPFAGALIDRFGSRKTAIVVTDAASAAVAAALVLFLATGPQGTAVLALLAVGSALRSVCAGAQMPAVQSAVPLLVSGASLTRYNGIASAVQSLAQFAAAPLAAFVLAFGGMAAVMALDIATAVVAIGVLAFAVKIPDAASAHTEDAPAAPGLFADVREGLRYACENRSVALVLGSYGAFMFLSVPTGFFVPLLMERAFGAPYALLAAAEAIGCVAMVTGGLVLAALANKVHNAMLPGGLIVYGAGSIGVGLATGYPVFFVSLAVLSAAISLVQAAAAARLQACVDPAMMGRAFGLMGSMYAGLVPLGSIVFGPLADAVPIGVLAVTCGAATVLLVGVVLWRAAAVRVRRRAVL